MEAIPRKKFLIIQPVASVASSKNFTIIYILFGSKVFLLVTKHEPEAVEQQGELQNDGSLSSVAPRSFKRRKTRNLKFSC